MRSTILLAVLAVLCLACVAVNAAALGVVLRGPVEHSAESEGAAASAPVGGGRLVLVGHLER
jgi:hypothetical protein